MGMQNGTRGLSRSKARCNPLSEAGQVENSEQDQHQPDGQLHRQTDPRRNHQVEKNNRSTDCENRDGVTDSPEDSDQACVANALLSTDDSSDGNHVIGVGGMPHSEKKTQRDDGEQGQTSVILLDRTARIARPVRSEGLRP